MNFHLIWAQDKNGGIGNNGQLPWHISEDLKKFKRITLNSTIIMGRKTWESLPKKPLPDRTNIVLSSKIQKGVTTYTSYEDCLNALGEQNIDKVFIIGGRSMYQLFFEKAQFLHITNINYLNKNINEFFPIPSNIINNNFHKVSEEILCNEATYTFWRVNTD